MRFGHWFYAAAVVAAVSSCGNTSESTIIPSLETLAESGNLEALYHLGMAYHTGSGVEQDHAKALDAFQKAAALGDPLASYKLGCYFDGQGHGLITDDPAQALKYKLVAAEAGYALAQQDVGALYGRSGDLTTALAWLQKSADQGWAGGLQTLASVYNGAPGIEPDPAKTAAYFELFLDRSEPSDKQREWLSKFEERLSSKDRDRKAEIITNYRAAPTPLTIKALSGQRAAQDLVARTGTGD